MILSKILILMGQMQKSGWKSCNPFSHAFPGRNGGSLRQNSDLKTHRSWEVRSLPRLLQVALMCLILFQPQFGQANEDVPSDEQIVSQLTEKSDKESLISIRITSSKKTIMEEIENHVRVLNYYRYYEKKFKTEHAGITGVYRGGVKYGYRGGSWTYISKLIGDVHYLGIQNPDWKEIEPFLKRDFKKVVGVRYSRIVGDVSDFQLADKPEWHWPALTSVEFIITMTYSEKISNTELQKTRQKYKVRLYADEYKGLWKKFISSAEGQGEKLALTKLSSDEMNKLKSLRDVDLQKNAQAQNANLPKVKIPDFINHGQMMLYLHRLLLSADAPTIESVLRKLLASGFYDPNLKNVLTGSGANLINSVKAQSGAYRKQFCKQPIMKHYQTNMSEWYNKNSSSYARLSSRDLGNGKRAIVALSLGVHSGKGQNSLEALACKARSNPLRRMIRTKLHSEKGAPVFSKYGKSEWWYIGRLAGEAKGGFKIQWLDGSATTESAKTVCNFELIPGDLVYIKNSSGEIDRRWVTENTGKTVIKVEDLHGRVSSVQLKDLRFK